MDKVDKDKIDEALMALRAMLRGGSITDDVYNKAAVKLAYDYALAQEMGEALAILNSLPLEYYQNVQEVQMREDPDFAKICTSFSELLPKPDGELRLKVWDPGDGWTFTQKPAKA